MDACHILIEGQRKQCISKRCLHFHSSLNAPRRIPHSEEPFSLHFPHFPGWTTKTIFVPFWFGHDLDNESRDGSAPQLLVSSHRDPL